MTEVLVEPIRGLPEALPEGERIVWQGEPDFKQFALHAFHLRGLALYFGAFVALRGAVSGYEQASPLAGLVAALEVLPLAVVGLAVVAGLARVYAKSAVFTITNRRVVMRFGVALPMSVNLPFKEIRGAGVVIRSDGGGDLPIALTSGRKLAYLHMWPFVRPWRFGAPEPMLRAVPDAARVAEILADTLVEAGHGVKEDYDPEAPPARADRPTVRGQLATSAK